MTHATLRFMALVATLACTIAASSQALAACPSSPGRLVANGAEVLDTKTGLIWRRCSEGQAWDGSTCTGAASSFSHAKAQGHAYGQMLATRKGWRLPTMHDLFFGVADNNCRVPKLDTAVFPSTPPKPFWSSSTDFFDASLVWVVDFNDGINYTYSRDHVFHVRLVRNSR